MDLLTRVQCSDDLAELIHHAERTKMMGLIFWGVMIDAALFDFWRLP